MRKKESMMKRTKDEVRGVKEKEYGKRRTNEESTVQPISRGDTHR